MVNKESRKEVRAKKHLRIRNRFSGTAERPRLAVFRSNNHMYAQIIDDTVGNTLVSASTLNGLGYTLDCNNLIVQFELACIYDCMSHGVFLFLS